MADNVLQFQDGREAAMRGEKRDPRRHKDWLEGFDRVSKAKNASYAEEPRG